MGNAESAAFPYEVAPEVLQKVRSGWELHSGWRKSDRKPVSVFIFNLPANDPGKAEEAQALAFLRRAKMLRLPNVLQFIDGLHMEAKKQVYVVTERVRPLTHVLSALRKQENVLAWGIYQILKGLNLLNDSGLIHANLGVDSVYVDKQGDWKLGGFELITEHSSLANPSIVSMLQQRIPSYALPPEFSKPEYMKLVPVPSIDSWLAGCFIFAVFFDGDFNEKNQLKNTGVVPFSLKDEYIGLITANPAKRLKSSEALSSGFFKSPLVDTCLFLEEINVKEGFEKERFFAKLPSLIDDFPEDVCKYKLLPHLTRALDFGGASGAPMGVALTPVLKISRKLSAEEFNENVGVSLPKWFKVNDRGLRANLLDNLGDFLDHVSDKIINEDIYPALSQCFIDAQPGMRVLAVKSVLLLAPKLHATILGDHLLKSLAKLQMDPEPPIRTNTTILLGNIAKFLTQDTRDKVLATAFSRAMRDNYGPSRKAAIQAFVHTNQYYSLRDTATKVIPAISFMTIDPEPEVRLVAIEGLRSFVTRMEQGQEALAKQQEAQKTNASSTFVLGAIFGTEDATKESKGMLGWALGKIYGSSTETAPAPTAAVAASPSEPAATSLDHARPDAVTPSRPQPPQPAQPSDSSKVAKKPKLQVSSWGGNFDDDDGFGGDAPAQASFAAVSKPVNDGWGDEGGDEGFSSTSATKSSSGDGWGDAPSSTSAFAPSHASGWGDDSSFEVAPARSFSPSAPKPSAPKTFGEFESNNSNVASPVKPIAAEATSAAPAAKPPSSWGDDDWGVPSTSTSTVKSLSSLSSVKKPAATSSPAAGPKPASTPSLSAASKSAGGKSGWDDTWSEF